MFLCFIRVLSFSSRYFCAKCFFSSQNGQVSFDVTSFNEKRWSMCMERHNCLMIFCFLIRGAFLIIFGACIMIFGALVAIIGASDLILGSLSKVLGTFHIIPGVHAIILTANRFILGAFAIIFDAWINFSGAAFFIFGG